MEQLKGVFNRSYYFNQSSGATSFSIIPKDMSVEKQHLDKAGNVRAVGKMCGVTKYTPLVLTGEWVRTEYGDEFHFTEAEYTATDRNTMILFLECLGYSLTTRNARKILDITGTDIFSSVDTKNLEMAICSRTRADVSTVSQTIARLRYMKTEKRVFALLDKYGGTYEQVTKIMAKYPDSAMTLLKKNPYKLLEKVTISFKMLDKIALDSGVEALSETRLQSILYYCIKRESNSGNVYITLKELIRSVNSMFGDIPKTALVAALANHPNIIKDPDHEDIYYEKRMLKDENLAAKEFVRLMYSRVVLPFHPEFIGMIEQEFGHPFGQQQKTSFQLLDSTGIKLLTGDPGTGKTTTMCSLLRYIEKLWEVEYQRKPKIALCAPSGRAAQRMKETTGRNALTVHKLLEYQPFGNSEYFKDQNDPIDAEVIVVDEVSMLGLSVFSKLIAAIKSGSLVLLIGDTNQLQSVEPGSVLYDIIHCGYVPTCHLTEVFRQAQQSLININAKKIINGDVNLLQGPDFELYQVQPEQTESMMLGVVNRLISEAGGDKNRVQVLAPVRKGTCGVKDGNNVLQHLFNPEKGGIWYGGRNFKVGDRVIMGINNYALNYFNGDIGYIKSISDFGMVIEIGEDEVKLPKEKYGDVDLAYNCTVHKSQGSEYEYLVIVLQEEAGGLLDKNLFYTAVTRGKKKVCVVYENNTMQTAIKRERKACRNSLLIEKIEKNFAKIR